jgi:hypothetical protein
MKIDRIWIALQGRVSPCSWRKFTPEENCLYVQEYKAKANKLGWKVEIATSKQDWTLYFQNQTACP